MLAPTVCAFCRLVVASVSAVAVEAVVCPGVVVGVGAYSTDWGVAAALRVMSEVLALGALVCGAGGKVFFSLALSAEDGDSIFE